MDLSQQPDFDSVHKLFNPMQVAQRVRCQEITDPDNLQAFLKSQGVGDTSTGASFEAIPHDSSFTFVSAFRETTTLSSAPLLRRAELTTLTYAL